MATDNRPSDDNPIVVTPESSSQIVGISIEKVILTVIAAAVLVVLVVQGCQGLYQIKPGEAAALQTFGAAKAEPVTDEGLHWHWPGPIGKTTVVQVQKSRTAEMGWKTLPDGRIDTNTQESWTRDLSEATMITGDLNLLETQ